MGGRSIVGLPPITTVTRQGLRWLLDLREVIDFSIWLVGAFELGTVRAYQRHSMTDRSSSVSMNIFFCVVAEIAY